MAQQSINIGSTANDGTGDPLRTAFDKINDNFSELYGSSAEANDLLEDSTPQLGGDLDVNGRRITSARSNEDIVLLPNGTGGVIASAVRIAGTTLSSDDSSTININEGLIVDGTVTVSGATALSSTLAVTGVATFTATPVFSADATFSDDASFASDGAIVSFGADSEVTLTHVHNDGLLLNTDMQLQFRDSAINIRSDADGDLDINADDEIELNSTLIDINGNVEISGTATTTGVHTFTATPVFSADATFSDDIALLSDSAVITFGADSDTSLTHTDGTGLTLNSTNKLCFNDASQFVQGISATVLGLGATDEIDLTATAIDINGTVDISGATTLAAITASGTATLNGAVNIAGAVAIGDLNILADGTITTDTNGDFVVDPAGTGAIVLTGPITATGVQTKTGQVNIELEIRRKRIICNIRRNNINTSN